MNQPGDPRLLTELARRMAARLTDDRTSLAWVFARYQAAEGLDDAGLARHLGVAPEVLPHLAICGRPRPDRFGEDVTAVAERFGVDRARLAGIVRQVEASAAFYRAPADDAGFLLAARDRVAEENAGYRTERDEPGDEPSHGASDGDEGEPR